MIVPDRVINSLFINWPMFKKIKDIKRGILDLRNFVRSHEITRLNTGRSYWRIVKWQIRSRIKTSPIDIPFVGGTILSVTRGMRGATGNIYAGLHEFHEMAFVLHFLRKGDLFADIGANIGSYAVLASGVTGARTVAFEPIARTAKIIERNLTKNRIEHLVSVREIALGGICGIAKMTDGDDTMNRVIAGDIFENFTQVQVSTLETEFCDQIPILIKIDAEGYDGDIVLGGLGLIQNPDVKALIVEFSGLGAREDEAHRALKDIGFFPYTYRPFERSLVPLAIYMDRTIYVRDQNFVEGRLSSAPAFQIFDHVI